MTFIEWARVRALYYAVLFLLGGTGAWRIKIDGRSVLANSDFVRDGATICFHISGHWDFCWTKSYSRAAAVEGEEHENLEWGTSLWSFVQTTSIWTRWADLMKPFRRAKGAWHKARGMIALVRVLLLAKAAGGAYQIWTIRDHSADGLRSWCFEQEDGWLVEFRPGGHVCALHRESLARISYVPCNRRGARWVVSSGFRSPAFANYPAPRLIHAEVPSLTAVFHRL